MKILRINILKIVLNDWWNTLPMCYISGLGGWAAQAGKILHVRPQEGEGGSFPPPETEKIVFGKSCYFPELYKMNDRGPWRWSENE